MPDAADQARQQPDAPVPPPILAYAPPPSAKVNGVLLGVLSAVAIVNVMIGSLLILLALREIAYHTAGRALGMIVLGLVHFLPGMLLWDRREWSWRRSYELLLISAAFCTALCLSAVMRLWQDRGGQIDDGTMIMLSLGGLFGAANLAAAFLLCRCKRAFQAVHVDTIWRQRVWVLSFIPLIELLSGFFIVSKFYA